MSHQNTHHSRVTSKASQDARADHERAERMRARGYRDGMEDSQPCELPPPELKDAVLCDCWTEGYRKAWSERRVAK